MIFRYVALPGDDRPRPFLEVRLLGPSAEFRALVLLDSGADESMLPMGWARALGLRFSGEQATLGSFTGEQVQGEVAEARLIFGRGAFSLTTRVVVDPTVRIPVLGHRDFFHRYRVTFDAGRSIFEVERPVVH